MSWFINVVRPSHSITIVQIIGFMLVLRRQGRLVLLRDTSVQYSVAQKAVSLHKTLQNQCLSTTVMPRMIQCYNMAMNILSNRAEQDMEQWISDGITTATCRTGHWKLDPISGLGMP